MADGILALLLMVSLCRSHPPNSVSMKFANAPALRFAKPEGRRDASSAALSCTLSNSDETKGGDGKRATSGA
jgi:hypothetical protein